VQIDGNAGLLVVDPSPAVARYYQQEAWVQAQIPQQQQVWLDKAGQTEDGIRLEVAANIAHSVEAVAAFNNGAQSVGLFRTEMLYMDRPGAPSEDELTTSFARRWSRPPGAALLCAPWISAAISRWPISTSCGKQPVPRLPRGAHL
jgi:fructose-specific PTS system IIA-like component